MALIEFQGVPFGALLGCDGIAGTSFQGRTGGGTQSVQQSSGYCFQ